MVDNEANNKKKKLLFDSFVHVRHGIKHFKPFFTYEKNVVVILILKLEKLRNKEEK